jgi:hypothetical protein
LLHGEGDGLVCDVIDEDTRARVVFANSTDIETAREAFTTEDWRFFQHEEDLGVARHPNASRADAQVPVVSAEIDLGSNHTRIEFHTRHTVNGTEEAHDLLEPRIEPVLANLTNHLGEPSKVAYTGGERCAGSDPLAR